MRESVYIALAAALLWGALALLARPGAPRGAEPPAAAETGTTEAGSEAPETGSTAAPEGSSDETAPEGSSDETAPEGSSVETAFDAAYRLPVLTGEGVVRMDLETYLTGVLLAEMPLRFEAEALKAQAVASRTYALRSCLHRRHEGAAVCTDSRCCQGWKDPTQVSEADRALAVRAVRATDGLAIYYQGALIDATFFSCSGGWTEDAAAVWGGELPYLRAVESPGEEEAAHYTDEVRVSLEDFRGTLEALDGAVRWEEDPADWVGAVEYTTGGGVDELELGGRPFRGTQLRKAFGLRSTAFTLTFTEAEAIFTTRGNGHRVGMSQYGAQAMAQQGATFVEILEWYYTGVEVRGGFSG